MKVRQITSAIQRKAALTIQLQIRIFTIQTLTIKYFFLMKTSIDKKTFQNLPSFEPPSSFFCSRWIFFTSWQQIGALVFPSVTFNALNFIIGNFVAITRVTQ